MVYNPEIDWSRGTGMLLGRFQPWNQGHRAMFTSIISMRESNRREDKVTPRQVCIMVRHQPDGEYTYEQVREMIIEDLEPEFHGLYTIMLVPNISNIFLGRQVGFDVERLNLPSDLEPVDNKKTTALEREYYNHVFWAGRG